MNLPNFKDILKSVLEKLSILKNNISVMISIIITVVALLLFIPTHLLSSGLKKLIETESVNPIVNKIGRLNNISEDSLQEAQEQLQSVVAEVNEISLKAIQTTKRELLKYNVFGSDPNDPNGSVSTSIFYEFGKHYCDKIDQFMSEHNAVTNRLVDEIEEILEEEGFENILENRDYESSYGSIDSSTQDQVQGMMVEQICKKFAESAFIYMDPKQISGYNFWSQFQYKKWDQEVEKCWYSQLGYWVIEDIFDTIVAMNEDYDSLATAPVKRLMKVYFSDLYKYNEFKGSSANYDDMPQYLFKTVDVPKETLTGRYCDGNYDVIHFNFKVVVDTKDIPQFFKTLCNEKEHKYIDKDGQTYNYKHNQISILGMTVKSVFMNSEEHNLYWYGDSNVSEVDLECEYIFNKKGYEDVMPQTVKNLFESGYDD